MICKISFSKFFECTGYSKRYFEECAWGGGY